MTAPAFTPGAALTLRAHLSEMPGCWLEARCDQCRNATLIPIKMLLGQYGPDAQIGAIAGRLTCKRCRVRPGNVWLNETHNRLHTHGAPPGWSVQLIGSVATASFNP